MSDYREKQTWTREGKHFGVEVVHWTSERPDEYEYSERGPHHWNVYALIGEGHPHFAKFDGPALFQDATCVLPLHCGASYLGIFEARHAYPDKPIRYVKVGSDYGHLHDHEFSHADNPEHAQIVFADADDLFTVLQGMVDAEPALVTAETLETTNPGDSNAAQED